MKFLRLAALVAAVMMSGCYAISGPQCGAEPCPSDTTATADASTDSGSIDSSADASSDTAGDTQSQTDVDATSPDADALCPPAGRPDATTLVKIQSGEVCVADSLEQGWAVDIDSRTWRYVESCGTIDSSLCTQSTKFHDVGYTPSEGFPWDPNALPAKLQGKYVLDLPKVGYAYMVSCEVEKAMFETPMVDNDILYVDFERKNNDLFMKLRFFDLEANEESSFLYKAD